MMLLFKGNSAGGGGCGAFEFIDAKNIGQQRAPGKYNANNVTQINNNNNNNSNNNNNISSCEKLKTKNKN